MFNDSATGMVGRAVWTDEHGDQAFSELRGEGTAADNKITGSFVGGTGRYQGATGTYEFSWRFMIENEDGVVQGQSIGLNGRVRVGPPQAAGQGGPQSWQPRIDNAAPAAPTNHTLRLMNLHSLPFVIAVAIWFSPVPAGLTPQAWHLFAIFITAIFSVLLGLLPLLTSTMLAAGAVVLTAIPPPPKRSPASPTPACCW